MKDMGETLVRRCLITRDQLSEAREVMAETGLGLRDVLAKMGFSWTREFVLAIGEEFQVDFLDLATYVPETELGRIVPEHVTRRYKVIPVEKKDDSIILAMADPSMTDAIEDVKMITNLEVIPRIAEEDQVIKLINKKYGVPKTKTTGKREIDTSLVSSARLRELADETSIVRIMDQMIIKALKEEVEEITIEPGEEEIRILFTVKGETRESMKPPRLVYPALNARIKIAAKMDHSDFKHCQQGKIEVKGARGIFDLSVSSFITPQGEKLKIAIEKRTLVTEIQETIKEKSSRKSAETQAETEESGSAENPLMKKILNTKTSVSSFLSNLIPGKKKEEAEKTKANKWRSVPDQKVYDLSDDS